MTDMWLPQAERHDLGNFGAMNGGAPKVTWHITSNDNDWNFDNEVGYFTSGGAGEASHLIWDPFSGRIAQMFPANSRSLSLQNDGDFKTNRSGTYNIQIEIVFTQDETVGGKKYHCVADTPRKNLDVIMAWVRSLGVPDVWPAGQPITQMRNTVSDSFYNDNAGHYGHCNVPGNSHVDPGYIGDIFHSGGGTPVPTPVYAPFPGDKYFFYGRTSALVTEVGKALVRAGYKGYRIGPGPVFGPADRRGIQWFQQNTPELAGDADGHFGPLTWKMLKVAQPR